MQAFNLNIGQCIYCDDSRPPLTREHILPRGLGGSENPVGHGGALVLQRASCEKCQKVTQSIEGECLRNMMEYARSRLGLKRKDRRSETVKARVDLLDGTSEEREVSADEILGPVVLPAFYEAGALSGKPFTTPMSCASDQKVIVVRPASPQLLRDTPRIGVELRSTPKTFGRMLAKIAHGITVAHYGLNGFIPTARNFILSNPEECGYWVGGFAGTGKAYPPSESLHRILLRRSNLKPEDLIVVEIQLFASYGGPNNYVVVGRAK